MREIKFRGMSINGYWHYGLLAHYTGSHDAVVKKGFYISNASGLAFAYHIRPETIGQYAGIKDKNGKDIYEGDIVRFKPDDAYEIGQVVFGEQNGAFCFYLPHVGTGIRIPMLNFMQTMSLVGKANFKVIGNIYENPELVKGA